MSNKEMPKPQGNRAAAMPAVPASPAAALLSEEAKVMPVVEPELPPNLGPAPAASDVALPPAAPVSSAIRVKAIRPGFWNGRRIKVGMEFNIPSLESAGEWMECLDANLKKAHREMIKNKKMGIRKAGV